MAIVYMGYVHAGCNGADASGCIDCEGTPWCW